MIYLPMTSDIAPWTLTCSKKLSTAASNMSLQLTNIFYARSLVYLVCELGERKKRTDTNETHENASSRVAYHNFDEEKTKMYT